MDFSEPRLYNAPSLRIVKPSSHRQGAFIALAVAKIIVREKRRVPAAFFVVEPPSLLPSSSVTSPGNLVDCPVYSFLHKDHRESRPPDDLRSVLVRALLDIREVLHGVGADGVGVKFPFLQ